MLPKYHIIIGGTVSIILYLLFQLSVTQVIITFLASFLIDVDHYLLYIFRKKDFSLKRSMNYFYYERKQWLLLTSSERQKYKKNIFLFHGIECWAIIFGISQFYPLLLFVLLGIAIHMILDYIDLISISDPLYRKFSQVYVFISNRKKKPFIG